MRHLLKIQLPTFAPTPGPSKGDDEGRIRQGRKGLGRFASGRIVRQQLLSWLMWLWHVVKFRILGRGIGGWDTMFSVQVFRHFLPPPSLSTRFAQPPFTTKLTSYEKGPQANICLQASLI